MPRQISESAVAYAVKEQASNSDPVSLPDKPAAAKRRGPGRPFVKGQSGNPLGPAVKGQSYMDYLKAERAKEARKLARKMVDLGLSNSPMAAIKAQEYLRNTLDGIPAQHLIIEREDSVGELLMRRLAGLDGLEAIDAGPALLPEPIATNDESVSST